MAKNKNQREDIYPGRWIVHHNPRTWLILAITGKEQHSVPVARVDHCPSERRAHADASARAIAAVPALIHHLNWLIKNPNQARRDAADLFLQSLRIDVRAGDFDDLR